MWILIGLIVAGILAWYVGDRVRSWQGRKRVRAIEWHARLERARRYGWR